MKTRDLLENTDSLDLELPSQICWEHFLRIFAIGHFAVFCISFVFFVVGHPFSSSFQSPRTKIFDYIISELGSLQQMDEQIRFLMGQMLKKNLANVGAATTDLLQELGQT